MALQDFGSRVMDRLADTQTTGDLSVTSTMLKDWLSEGANDIVSRIPQKKLVFFAKEPAAFAPTTGVAVETDKIIDVFRNDGTIDQPCRVIPSRYRGRATDSDDLMYASETDPVWYIDQTTNGTQQLKILPTSASSIGKVVHVQNFEVNATDTAINGFPNELEKQVVNFAIMGAKIREAGHNRRQAQTEIEAITDSGILSNLSGSTKVYGQTATALDAANSALDNISAILSTATTSISTNEDIEKGQAQIQAGLAYAQEASGYLSEAGNRLGKGGLYLKEAAVRIQNANHYLQHSGQAIQEVTLLRKEYETSVDAYIKRS